MILDKTYFSANAKDLARDLVGKIICRLDRSAYSIAPPDNVSPKNNNAAPPKIIRARITETECYCGEEDTACHAHRGRTPRTEVLYSAGGVAYVYLCYGMYDLFNIVTGAQGHPEAVLIRGVEGAVGPGRTTRYLGITREYNRLPLDMAHGLWIEDDGERPRDIIELPRVGIGYASAEDQARLWRFMVENKPIKKAPRKSSKKL